MGEEIEITKQKLTKEIRKFDLCSLIALLETMGFYRKDIYFKSHLTTRSPPSLCESIVFSDEKPKVQVLLNMGLLSNNSPLPSYFLKYMDSEEIDGERFVRFLSFFNHHLIKDFLLFSEPKSHLGLFSDWKETQYYYLRLLGFESISTLWFLVQSVFPELGVEIKKNPRVIRLDSASLVLGRDGLGSMAYIGKRYEQTLSSFKVTVSTETDVSDQGIHWPVEVNNRFIDVLFPLLQRTDIHLSLILLVKHKYTFTHLSKTRLGFDRIGVSNAPMQLLLFHGLIRDLEPNKYLAS